MNKPLLIGCAVAGLVLLAVMAVAGVTGAWLYFHRAEPSLPVAIATPHDTPVTVPPAPAVSSQRFVFVRDGWIYLVAAPGAPPVRVARGAHPALSPDGVRIAYYRSQENNSDDASDAPSAFMLWVIERGSERELLPSDGCMSPPAWSPDGSSVVLPVIAGNNVPQLILVNIATDEKTLLVQATHEPDMDMILSPAWSGDGGSIFFHDMTRLFELDASGRRLHTTPLAEITGSETCVTSSDRFLPCPTDANLLAYTRLIPASAGLERVISEPTTALFIFDSSSHARRQLTTNAYVAFDPAWSRDGQTLTFCGYPESAAREMIPFRVFRIGRDGAGLIEIARGEQPAL